MSYEVLKSEQSYKGKVFKIERDLISLPDGRTTIRETIIHGGAAAMIPVDAEGKIIFVRQYRHSAKAMTLEIPAGTIEKGENPYDCAMREIQEETSYKCNDMKLLFTMYSAIGFCTEKLYIYLCENLEKGEFNMDEDEFITIERYTPEESVEMIYNGQIYDSKTIAAIFAYRDYISKKQK